MDEAGLNDRVGGHRGDRIGKAPQAINDGEQDILDARVSEFVHHPKPELGAFVLLQPQAKHFLATVGADAQRDVDRFVANHPFVADFHPDRIEEHQRLGRIQWPLLPSRDFIEHGVGHRADQVGRDVDAVQIVQMPHDLAGAHVPRVHRHDLFVEAGEAALVFGDQLRVEAGLAVARYVNRQLAGIGHHGLPTVAVPHVIGAAFAGQVMVHLRVQDALGQRLLP